jgi:hypothetical protein
MSKDNNNQNDETATMAEKTTDIFTAREQEIMLNALLCMKEAPTVSLLLFFCRIGAFSLSESTMVRARASRALSGLSRSLFGRGHGEFCAALSLLSPSPIVEIDGWITSVILY